MHKKLRRKKHPCQTPPPPPPYPILTKYMTNIQKYKPYNSHQNIHKNRQLFLPSQLAIKLKLLNFQVYLLHYFLI